VPRHFCLPPGRPRTRACADSASKTRCGAGSVTRARILCSWTSSTVPRPSPEVDRWRCCSRFLGSKVETTKVPLRMRAAIVAALSVLVLGAHAAPALAAPTEQAAAQRVLELTNVERRNAGLGTLVLSAQLNDAAQGYAQVLAGSDCFAHTCGPVPDFGVRFRQAGYTGWNAIAE